MNAVMFVAGVVTGIIIGPRRGRADAIEGPPEPFEPDPDVLHQDRMEAILRGEWTPTPSERREADAWRDARQAGRGGATPHPEDTH